MSAASLALSPDSCVSTSAKWAPGGPAGERSPFVSTTPHKTENPEQYVCRLRLVRGWLSEYDQTPILRQPPPIPVGMGKKLIALLNTETLKRRIKEKASKPLQTSQRLEACHRLSTKSGCDDSLQAVRPQEERPPWHFFNIAQTSLN